MSRRDKEFKKRTSIFEGAFRAWSFLDSLDPEALYTKPLNHLDPLNTSKFPRSKNLDSKGIPLPEYPYVPLPRCGLEHPFIVAILVLYMGPCTNKDAFKVALSTLRTWWHHRRGGENKTALRNFENEKFRNLVDTYTRYFFKKAHYCVTVNHAVPPRGLAIKLKEKRAFLNELGIECRRGNSRSNEDSFSIQGDSKSDNTNEVVDETKIDNVNQESDIIPIVYESSSGELHILLQVKGITSPHCVKILETVLLGCNGRGTPIADLGLQDVAADNNLSTVIIKIDRKENAQRIALEACRNFSLVGYQGKPVALSQTADKIDQESACKVFSWAAATNPDYFFDWRAPCSCPDCGIFREGCARHSQMNVRWMDSLKARERLIRNGIPPAIDSEALTAYPVVDDDEMPIQVDQDMRFDIPPTEEQRMPKTSTPSSNFFSLTDALYEALIYENDRQQDMLARQFQLSVSQQTDDVLTPYSIDWGLPSSKRRKGEGGGQA